MADLDTDIDIAERAVWRAARRKWTGTPDSVALAAIVNRAIQRQLVRLLARSLPGGEVEFWRLVQEDIER